MCPSLWIFMATRTFFASFHGIRIGARKGYSMLLRRRNTRRNPGWNYASPGWYFLTIVTRNRKPVFGTIINDEVLLNAYGCAALACWEESKTLRSDMSFDTICIMPDHIHMLVKIKRPRFLRPTFPRRCLGKRTKRSISSFVALYKGACTRAAQSISLETYAGRLWQRGYDDQIVRYSSALPAIRRYIRDNPRHHGSDTRPLTGRKG